MLIKSLQLENFRGFTSQKFSLSNRVAVIAGINGRGKSSILDATALLLSNILPGSNLSCSKFRQFAAWSQGLISFVRTKND